MNIIINGNVKVFDTVEMSVASLVMALDLTGRRLAIERNGEIVPRSQFTDVLLQNNDRLEIVGAVGGG